MKMLPLARGIYGSLAQITRNSRLALHTASVVRGKAEAAAENEAPAENNEESAANAAPDPKDRTNKIPVETSIRYLKSAAYKTTYGDEFVWTQYRYAAKNINFECLTNFPFTYQSQPQGHVCAAQDAQNLHTPGQN